MASGSFDQVKKERAFRGSLFLAPAFNENALTEVAVVAVTVRSSLDNLDLVVKALHDTVGDLAGAEVIQDPFLPVV